MPKLDLSFLEGEVTVSKPGVQMRENNRLRNMHSISQKSAHFLFMEVLHGMRYLQNVKFD